MLTLNNFKVVNEIKDLNAFTIIGLKSLSFIFATNLFIKFMILFNILKIKSDKKHLFPKLQKQNYLKITKIVQNYQNFF